MIYSIESGLTRRSKNEIEKELELATNWLSSKLGIDFEKTRLGEYLRYLSGKEKVDSFEDFQQYLLTARELDSLLRIFRTFINDECDSLVEKVETAISGQYYRHRAAQKSHDPSRDYLHELSVASRFKDCGLLVDISGDCDIVVNFENKKIFIECKRIKSEEKLYRRFKSAECQLRKRLGTNTKNKIGFIAIDITDLINTDDKVFEFNDVNALKDYFYRKLYTFVERHKSKMREYVRRETKSILFFVSGFGCIPENESQKGAINVTLIHALGCESSPKDEVLNAKILRGIL